MLIVALGSVTSGCSSVRGESVYQTWAKQLMFDAPRRHGRVDDVSLLLGTQPTRCEPLPEQVPGSGFAVDPKTLVVILLLPNSPSEQSGMRLGDTVTGIGGQPVANAEQFQSTYQSQAREGQPLAIETNRGVFTVVPRLYKVEQCYWDVQGGQVARGSAYYGGASYQRFFRASCRTYDGFVLGCQTNWQY
jgi:hypothetical protein